MTKKQLLKWLDARKSEALLKVSAEEVEAKKALKAWKLEATHFGELIAEIGPKLNEVYDRMESWHKENEDLCGRECNAYNTLRYRLGPIVSGSTTLEAILAETEFRDTHHDTELNRKYMQMRTEVERTYINVAANVSGFANAKLGMEYLESLGFDLSELKAQDEKPVETALAVPINTQFLLLNKKEA
ncbi:hypothetical protein [Acutalibacter muris]|uniref:hypothetical protein n=1 Tax=Acutalibacter muris TaxID=1796620 RepID=UPI00272D061D|nr:hypothetical protein [Acutalibacter muris]